MSWIIVDTRTGKALAEVWTRRAADRAAAVPGLKSVPVLEWLQGLNSNQKEHHK